MRTDAEWTYVGLCDLASAGKQPVLVAWQVFPRMEVNGAFLDQLKAARRRWAVGGGERKRDALRAALTGGWVDVLVTDLETARHLAGVDGSAATSR